MVSFLQSNAAVMTALLASVALTEAAYGRVYLGSRPSMALGSRMLLSLSDPSLFSRDIRRVMHDVDEMFGTMLGDMDEMFYEPLSLQRSRPYYLLQGKPAANALSQSSKAENAFGITQDDKQIQIAVDVPGAKASDINLQLEEDNRLLRISGETKYEEGGISVHSQFERSFTLNCDIDTSQISAQMDNGVLVITAPKYKEAKDTARRIDVVETKKVESDEVADTEEGVDVSSSHEKEESQKVKPEVDESVIDLDEKE